MLDDILLTVPSILEAKEPEILAAWLSQLKAAPNGARVTTADKADQAAQVLKGLRLALSAGIADARAPAFSSLRETLADISGKRAIQGSNPGETASFIFSCKQPVVNALRDAMAGESTGFTEASLAITALIDELGIFTFEVFQKAREDVILRQQREIAELSTPVVKLWERVLALPLIGTLDSERTQVVMENLLQSILDEEAEIAIIDITGVPTVDTLVAQHLLKTVAAARLMGADCIISGIRPQIAQTMVHLGVELNVISKASLADAFAVALARTGKSVVSQKARF